MHRLLAEVMRDTGVGKGSAAELVERGITRVFLPHGLGHSLGPQIWNDIDPWVARFR